MFYFLAPLVLCSTILMLKLGSQKYEIANPTACEFHPKNLKATPYFPNMRTVVGSNRVLTRIENPFPGQP